MNTTQLVSTTSPATRGRVTAKAGPVLPALLTEEVRRLCAQFVAGADQAKRILVAGPAGGEGVTTVAAALALELGRVPGMHTLLVDANVRSPRVHTIFGLPLGPGLMTWNSEGELPTADVAGVPGLKVLAAGMKLDGSATGDSSAESFRLAKIAADVARVSTDEFDFVVWDAAPVSKYPDATMLARLVDGVFFVVEADRTRLDHLAYAREQMAGASGHVIGAILNRTRRYWPLKAKGRR